MESATKIRIVVYGIATVTLVLIAVPVTGWPVALGIVKAVAVCGVAIITICRRH